MGDLYNHDEDLLIMKQNISDEFLACHHSAFEAYKHGDWQTAKQQFESAQTLNLESGRKSDGPSMTIMNYMKKFDYKSPIDWCGARQLTEK